MDRAQEDPAHEGLFANISASDPRRHTLTKCRRLAHDVRIPIALLFLSILGGAGLRAYFQGGTVVAPETPIASAVSLQYDDVSEVHDEMTAYAAPRLPSTVGGPSVVGIDGRCGPIICSPGHTCCPGTMGHVCVAFGGRCCQGNAGSIACGSLSTCHFNDGGNAYCCGSGAQGRNNVCILPMGACFPGEASVLVRWRGALPMNRLRRDDEVLVRQSSGALLYEPVLGFLHVVRREAGGKASYLTVHHAEGRFRASANHLVFTDDGDKLVAEITVGDRLLLASGTSPSGVLRPAEVLRVERSEGSQDMYAPLTASGTIFVDGVLASTYATHVLDSPLRHATIHAFLFPVRACYALRLTKMLDVIQSGACRLGGSYWWQFCANGGAALRNDTEEVHPFINFVRDHAIAVEAVLVAWTS